MVTYILIGVAVVLFVGMLIFSATAHKRFVKHYNRYMQHQVYSGYTGGGIANLMIRKYKLKTKIFLTKQEFADSFHSRKNIVLLNEKVANNSTIASIAITAHEMGHAFQHKNKHFLFRLSIFLAYLSVVARFILPLMIIAGIILLFFTEYNLIGQILLIVSACLMITSYLLKLVNIPVEFGASKIAYNFLKDNEILSEGELKLAKKMLRVAGQTYIASLFIGFVKFFKKIGNSFRS